MPTYRITAPNGKTYDVTGNGTKEEALAQVQAQLGATPQPAPVAAPTEPQQNDMGRTMSTVAGAMKPFENIGMAGLSALQAAGVPIDDFLRSQGLQTMGEGTQQNNAARANSPHPNYVMGGEIASTLPVAAMAPQTSGLAATAASLIGQGAVTGALLSDAQDVGGIATDAAYGGAGSLAGGAAVHGAGRIISPTVDAGVKALTSRGIPLTLGQIIGGGVKKTEDALTSVLGLGNMIDAARRRGTTSFNRAAFNEALDPLGIKLPDAVGVGHTAVKFTKDVFKKGYDRVLGGMTVAKDAPLVSELAQLEADAAAIPGDMTKPYLAVIKKHVEPYFDAAGNIPGRAYKEIDRQLRKISVQFGQGSGAEKAYAELIHELRGSLRESAKRNSAPGLTNALGKLDEAYAGYVPLRDAASKTSDGVFAPGGLETSVRIADKSVGKGRKASGDAMLQGLSGPARDIMPSSLGESGTVPRALVTGGLAGGAQAFGLIEPSTLATAAVLASAYTKFGQKAVQAALTGRQGPKFVAIRNYVERSAPAIAGAAPALLARPD